MATFHKATTTVEVEPGKGKVVSVGGKDVALFNVNGEFFAISNTCLHRGGPLGEGVIENDIVTCPWHGWQWNIKTGVNAMNPSTKVSTFQVKVEGTDVMVAVE